MGVSRVPMGATGAYAGVLAIIVVVVLIAMILLFAHMWHARAVANTAVGAGENGDDTNGDAVGGSICELDNSLWLYARRLHLDPVKGGSARAPHSETGKSKSARAPLAKNAANGVAQKELYTKPWVEFGTWTALKKNPPAWAQYLADRDAFRTAAAASALDWSAVMAVVTPLLAEDREYIGLINVTRGDSPLPGTPAIPHVTLVEASTTRAGEHSEGGVKGPRHYASVPPELVEKVCSTPALYLFHTHPADPRVSPYPSPADVATSIKMAYTDRYAANLVISRYGVVLYTAAPETYGMIRGARLPDLAAANLCFDAAAALSGTRCWRPWAFDELARVHELYGLAVGVVRASPDFEAERTRRRLPRLTAPSCFNLLDQLRGDIARYAGGGGSRHD